MNLVREMLLIDEPAVHRLYEELIIICRYFVIPSFLLATLFEFMGSLQFAEIVKRLFIVTLFLSFFYTVHTHSVDLAMDTAYATLKKVSPNNIFIKKWYQVKVETKEKNDWGWIKKFAVPNLNDLVATTLFVISKVCIWLLQLIYSTVYHFTYLFAGFAALFHLFKWTDRGLIGIAQSMAWCVLMPFVLIGVLSMVSNTLSDVASNGGNIKTIVWIFGVTLILLITPIIAGGIVKESGIANAAGKMGQMSILGIVGAAKAYPMMKRGYSTIKHSYGGRAVRSITRSSVDAAKTWAKSYKGERA